MRLIVEFIDIFSGTKIRKYWWSNKKNILLLCFYLKLVPRLPTIFDGKQDEFRTNEKGLKCAYKHLNL